MSQKEIQDIYECLKGTSYDDPMPIRDVSEICKIKESHVSCPQTRKLVKKVMKIYNVPIGASHKGYYIIRNAHEMQRYLNLLLRRQLGITKTIDICYHAFHGDH